MDVLLRSVTTSVFRWFSSTILQSSITPLSFCSFPSDTQPTMAASLENQDDQRHAALAQSNVLYETSSLAFSQETTCFRSCLDLTDCYRLLFCPLCPSGSCVQTFKTTTTVSTCFTEPLTSEQVAWNRKKPTAGPRKCSKEKIKAHKKKKIFREVIA